MLEGEGVPIFHTLIVDGVETIEAELAPGSLKSAGELEQVSGGDVCGELGQGLRDRRVEAMRKMRLPVGPTSSG